MKVFGKDVADWNISSLRQVLAVVTQGSFLFSDSIMENIRYGNPEATDDAVIEAAKAAYIHDFIGKLPEGYSTLIGERAYVCRTVLKNAPILLLDDRKRRSNCRFGRWENSRGRTARGASGAQRPVCGSLSAPGC